MSKETEEGWSPVLRHDFKFSCPVAIGSKVRLRLFSRQAKGFKVVEGTIEKIDPEAWSFVEVYRIKDSPAMARLKELATAPTKEPLVSD